MKTLLTALALLSGIVATGASAEPATGSAVGHDQDLMIVGRAPAGAVVSGDTRLTARTPDVEPSDTRRTPPRDRAAQGDLPAA